jgi:hypothetical protein
VARYAAIVAGILLGMAGTGWVTAKGRHESPKTISETKIRDHLANEWGMADANKKDLAEYVALADYNREIVNWKVADAEYQENVLSPVLKAGLKPDLKWRRELWIMFYPQIRNANSSLAAARILAAELRGEVEIHGQNREDFDFGEIWSSRLASGAEFEYLYVAALRSIGVGARINSHGGAEIFNSESNDWVEAPPAPVLIRQ